MNVVDYLEWFWLSYLQEDDSNADTSASANGFMGNQAQGPLFTNMD